MRPFSPVRAHPERAALGFATTVGESFSFLEELGFRVVEKQVTLVIYRSRLVEVRVYHGRASSEIGIEVQRLDMPRSSFSLGEIVRASTKRGVDEDLRQLGGSQTSSAEGVRHIVKKRALLLEAFGREVLNGDREMFEQLRTRQHFEAAEYTKSVQDRGIRAQIGPAWAGEKFEQVVELYGRIRGRITPAELMKLEYSRKQVLAAKERFPLPRKTGSPKD